MKAGIRAVKWDGDVRLTYISVCVYKRRKNRMKIKGDYILDTIGGEKMAVPLSANENNQTGLIRLNEVGAFLWEKLMEGTTEEKLVQDVTKQYEVETEKAAKDVKKFLDKLKSQGLLED